MGERRPRREVGWAAQNKRNGTLRSANDFEPLGLLRFESLRSALRFEVRSILLLYDAKNTTSIQKDCNTKVVHGNCCSRSSYSSLQTVHKQIVRLPVRNTMLHAWFVEVNLSELYM